MDYCCWDSLEGIIEYAYRVCCGEKQRSIGGLRALESSKPAQFIPYHRASQQPTANRFKRAIKFSFIIGFLTAVLIGYGLLYHHFITFGQLGAVPQMKSKVDMMIRNIITIHQQPAQQQQLHPTTEQQQAALTSSIITASIEVEPEPESHSSVNSVVVAVEPSVSTRLRSESASGKAVSATALVSRSSSSVKAAVDHHPEQQQQQQQQVPSSYYTGPLHVQDEYIILANINKNKISSLLFSANKKLHRQEGEDELLYGQVVKRVPIFQGVNKQPIQAIMQTWYDQAKVADQDPSSRDVILGLAANIDAKYFAIFAASLRVYNLAAQVIILVNTPIPDRVQLLAKEYQITLIDYELKQIEPAYLQSYHPSSLRWILYDRLFHVSLQVAAASSEEDRQEAAESKTDKEEQNNSNNNSNNPNNKQNNHHKHDSNSNNNHNNLYFGDWIHKIITVDVRDTVFQGDPFTLLPSSFSSSTVTDLAEQPKQPAIATDILYVFGEEATATIGNCGWNSGWIKDCFGQDILHNVYNKPIICSGVSMGTAKVMRRYIERMRMFLTGFKQLKTTADQTAAGSGFTLSASLSDLLFTQSKFPTCERNGVDQGLHNIIVYLASEELGISVQYPNHFPVINMQSAPLYQPLPDHPGELFMNNNASFAHQTAVISQNKLQADQSKQLHSVQQPAEIARSAALAAGNRFLLVHQYDRCASLQIALAHRYVKWITWSNLASEWSSTDACQVVNQPSTSSQQGSSSQVSSFAYLQDVDLFRGLCDVRSARAISAASCCEACTRKSAELLGKGVKDKQCTGFTYSNGVCYLKSCNEHDVTVQVNRWKESNDGGDQHKRRDRQQMQQSGAISAYLTKADKKTSRRSLQQAQLKQHVSSSSASSLVAAAASAALKRKEEMTDRSITTIASRSELQEEKKLLANKLQHHRNIRKMG